MSLFKDKKMSRLKFLKKAVLLLLGIEFGYLIFDFLKHKKIDNNTEEWYIVGNIDDFETDKFYPFSKGNFFIYKHKDGGLLAISHRCTHLGCAILINKTGDGFHCPCHASNFNKYGEVKSPPATRALDIFPIKIIGHEISVNINKPIKRNDFDKSQLTYV